MSTRRPWSLARSLVALRAEYDRAWPGRDTTSDGTIGDDAHAGRTSDHNPDAGGVVRALDLDGDVPGGIDGAADLAEHLRDRRDPRVKYVIHAGRMFSAYDHAQGPAWTWRPYTGPNPHTGHVHVSVVADRRAQDDAPWRYRPQEDPMLRQGHRGNAVELLQACLLRWNADTLPEHGADGAYGTETAAAVARYQRSADLPDTGTADALTVALLTRYAPPAPIDPGSPR